MTVEQLIKRLSKLDKKRMVKIKLHKIGTYREIDNDFDDGYQYDAYSDTEFYEL